MSEYLRSYVAIDIERIKHNIKLLQDKTNKRLIGVIKANGYGTSDILNAKLLVECGVNLIAVSSVDEAVRLRDHGIDTELLILGYVDKKELKSVRENNLSIVTVSRDYVLSNLNDLKGIKVHIKINTGMNRIGINPSEVKEIFELLNNHAYIEGIMSHYCCADNDEVQTRKQFELFKECVKSLKHDFKYIHISATDGSFLFKEDFSTHVRCGIGILGYTSNFSEELKPAVSLYSTVIDCKIVPEGEGISYGHHYHSDGKSYILTLPIGYADGLLRRNTGKQVYVDGEYGTIVGSICMDQMMVKVEKPYPIGTRVEIYGKHIDITSRAKDLGTINYELLVDLSDRLTRVYVKEDELVEITKPRFI